MPFEEMTRRIREKTGMSEQELMQKISDKCSQLAGLISKDGAANIIANELGVQLFQQEGKLKIKDAFPGMRSVDIAGKVVQMYEAREFARQDGSTGKLASFVIGDETGTIRVVAWGSKADEASTLGKDMTIMLQQAQVRENNRGGREVHLGDNSRIITNPNGVTVGEVKAFSDAARKQIKDLSENDQNTEILGTIVQVFDPKYFEVCPQCNKRAKPDASGAVSCAEHGQVAPTYGMVGNAYVDDGTGNIRVVFFRNQLERLTKKSTEELLAYREMPEKFEAVKTELLGTIVRIIGKANKNQFFDRLEFVAQLVHEAPPEEELKRLQAQV